MPEEWIKAELDYNPEIQALIQERVAEISDIIGRIDPDLVLKLTIGPRSIAGIAGKDTFRDRFTKEGDGFANVWGEKGGLEDILGRVVRGEGNDL